MTLSRTIPVVRSVLGAVLLLVAPALLVATVDPSAATALVAFALATVVLLLVAHGGAAASWHAVTIRPQTEAITRVVTGRVTDPVHHPIRPRAPGIG
jgi:hypothetical protein